MEEKSPWRETKQMIRIHVFAEGQTEETFVRDVLGPHYAHQQIFFDVLVAQTSRGYKGGIVSYAKIKPQIERLCKQDHQAYVTTMMDLYGYPADAPGKNDPKANDINQEQKALFLEKQLAADIKQPNFIPNLMVHEYEALLFCQPGKFAICTDEKPEAIEQLQTIRDSVETPEQINDDPQTAPSKRIKAIMPQYQKTLHGPLIAEDIGLDELRKQCPHFNQWLKTIEQIAAENSK